MLRTSRWLIVRPRPVPPSSRARSRLTERLEDRAQVLGFDPDAGVDHVETQPRPAAPAPIRSSTSPCGVNLIALPSRLRSTWRRCRPSSTTRGGDVSSMSRRERQPLALRPLLDDVARDRRPPAAGRTASLSMSMRPASIFDRSSTSLMRSSRCEPQALIASSASRCAGLQRAVALQQLGVADDAVERRPQLVAHVGEELALGPRRGFGRLLRLPQLVLVPQPLGDVADERAEEIPAAGADRRW